MKKTISLFLALCLLAGCFGASAFADGEAQAPDKSVTMKFDDAGLALTLPEAFTEAKGVLEPFSMGEFYPGLYVVTFFYIGVDKDAYADLDDNNLTEEQNNALKDATGILAYVFAVGGGRTEAAVREVLAMPDSEKESFTEVGKAEDVTFYLYTDKVTDAEYLPRLAPEFAEEYTALQSQMPEVLKNAVYAVPVPAGSELIGRTLRFETKNIDGIPVKSEDIFSQHEITMVNVWATWCGPCRSELAELGEIDRRLAAKDCAVLGICVDADEATDTARDMIREYRLDYLNIRSFDGLDDVLMIEGYPTTVFVGRDGTILAPPVIGVPYELSLYEETIDSLLSDAAPESDIASVGSEAHADAKDKYNVYVTDSEGAPVKGVTVQFCSDDTCTLGKTDADGLASFDAEEGQVYTIHILKVPEGVEKSDEEYRTPEVYSDICIVLRKSA